MDERRRAPLDGTLPGPGWVLSLITALVCFTLVRIGLSVDAWHDSIGAVWPASGWSIAALVLGGRRLWVGVLLGNALALATHGSVGVATALAMGVSNTAEALLGAFLLFRLRTVTAIRADLAWMIAFAAAAVLAPLPSVTGGLAALRWMENLPGLEWHQAAITWGAANALGIFIVTPFLLACADALHSRAPVIRRQLRRIVLTSLVLFTVLGLIFSQPTGGHFLFALFPIILLAFVLGGTLGATCASLLTAVVGVTATSQGLGPFAQDNSTPEGLLHLQIFLAAVGTVALLLRSLRGFGGGRLAGVVLLVGWLLSGWWFSSLQTQRDQADAERFRSLVASAEDAIRRKTVDYENVLRSAGALWTIAGSLDATQWRDYVETLDLPGRYPGLHGLGVIQPVAESDLPSFLAARVRDYGPVYSLKQLPAPESRPAEATERLIVSHVEPLTSNASVLGLDASLEFRRREVLEQARDLAAPRISRRISLVQAGREGNGFLFVSPFYPRDADLSSVESRRASLRGWVYAPFLAEEFLHDALGFPAHALSYSVFDGAKVDPAEHIAGGFAAPDSPYEAVTMLTLAGNTFTIGWNRAADFPVAPWTSQLWTASALVVVTLLTAGLVISLQSTGRQARRIAAERTADLAASRQQLQESNRLQRAVLDSTSLSIIATDTEGLIRDFNAGAEAMLGYTRDEMVGRHTPTILHLPEEVAARARSLSESLRRPIAPSFETFVARAREIGTDEHEWTYVRKDGRQLPVQLNVTVLRDASGVITGYLGIARDISRRRAAERALRISEERTRLFADHAPAAVAMFDREMRYLVTSKAWLQDYGLVGQNVIGRSHYEVFPEIPPHWKELHRRCLAGEVLKNDADPFVRADGHQQWLSWEIRPWHGPDGEIGGIMMLTRDVTARRQLETDLARARDEALAASRLKSEFLANMSHEIRTPMNGVIGMASLLMDTALTPDQHEMGRAIQHSAESLLHIINDILDYSKIESGKFSIEPVIFDPRDLLDETLLLLAPAAESKRLELVSDFDPQLTQLLLGDAGRLRQILLNLTGNAIKFTDRGEVVVSVRRLDENPARPCVRWEVRDTGIGIKTEAQARLFQPFMQADGSITRRFGGTGLGLAISRHLVQLMGGAIAFESTSGSGSRFWFDLPLETAGPRPEDQQAELPQRRILIVDDNASSRTALHRCLSAWGQSCDELEDGRDLLAALSKAHARGTPFDLILIDTGRAPWDPASLAAAVRSQPDFASLPLVLMAPAIGTSGPHTSAFNALLTKPVRHAPLRRCLLGLFIPDKPPPAAMVRSTSPFPETRGPSLRILLAEDNPTNQAVARRLLEKLGHSAVVVADGTAALACLEADPRFDAILMDCQMPGMDGFTATRHIRDGRIPGVKTDIPIIALTAYAMSEDRLRCIQAGMTDYLSKPVRAAAISEALRRWVRPAPSA